MPNLKASYKDVRRINSRRLQNRQKISRLRTFRKKLLLLIAESKLEEAQKEYQELARYLDRAGRRRVIHPSRSSRYKSRLARLLNQAKKAAENAV